MAMSLLLVCELRHQDIKVPQNYSIVLVHWQKAKDFCSIPPDPPKIVFQV